jgi:potassium-transporting ATPase KdpC subunit
MKKEIFTALKFLLVMIIITGVLYPVLMTGLAQLIFPSKSNGSMIKINGKLIGSELIGQKFDDNRYFWSRPSATSYNTVPSGGSNYGPTSDTLKKLMIARRSRFAQINSVSDTLIVPKEMMFASGSGLDPHISPEAALLQVDRIVRIRQLTNNQKEDLLKTIKDISEAPQYLCLGEPRINVLKLNLELDNIQKNNR